MFEQELVKTGGIKLFGSTFFGLTLIALGGILMWQVWRDRQAFQNLHLKNVTRKYEEKIDHVKMRLEALTVEQDELLSQIAQLREKFSYLRETADGATVLVNSIKREVDASKLAMLKHIMEDNVKIRQTL
jgi:predicted negative regulator of RcsB-dependent stress response